MTQEPPRPPKFHPRHRATSYGLFYVFWSAALALFLGCVATLCAAAKQGEHQPQLTPTQRWAFLGCVLLCLLASLVALLPPANGLKRKLPSRRLLHTSAAWGTGFVLAVTAVMINLQLGAVSIADYARLASF